MPKVLLTMAVLAGAAAPALADEPAPSRPDWLPQAAATAAIIPGLGHLVLGEPREAGIAFGATVAPSLLAFVAPQPYVFADLPAQKASLWEYTAQEAWLVQMHLAFQEGRRLTGNAGFPQPLVQHSVADLVAAPFQLDNLLDPAVWSVVAANFMVGVVFDNFLPDPDQAPTPFVFTARSAQLAGATIPTGVGYAANAGMGAVLAVHAGLGEEAFFRGTLQDSLEPSLGQWGSLAVSSSIFGLAHVGGVNQTSPVKQFLEPGLAGALLGRLYQTSGYDLRKAVAAHAYYDTLSFALSALRPNTAGNNLLGLQFQF